MISVFTLYEKSYHRGVGALVNSLINCGYSGNVYVGYRDHKPPWVSQLKRLGECEYYCDPIHLHFFQVQTPMHLGFFKPFAALDIFERYEEIDSLVYADPDIAFLADWDFFRSWLSGGLAFVGDCTFDRIPVGHPWRNDWEILLTEASLEIRNSTVTASYVNGGFFGVSREQSSLLHIWCKLTDVASGRFCDITRYEMSARTRSVVSDQDLINASLLAHTNQPVILGPEAMGFTGYDFVMSHAVASPKPWNQVFTFEAIKGNRPSRACEIWLRSTSGPIEVIDARIRCLKKIDMKIAKLISRFWRR